ISHRHSYLLISLFFFNDTATTDIYTLSLHDALPIWNEAGGPAVASPARQGYGSSVINDLLPYEFGGRVDFVFATEGFRCTIELRSEEHTSELQSLTNLVCRLLLEKKKIILRVVIIVL